MQTTQVYGVERVYDDLRSPYVTKDVIKQLSQLDIVVGDIFNRLAHKVGQERERVAAIDRRIRTCQAKVNAITQRRTSNKPTTVFSTSKYPAPKVLPSTRTLFHDKPYAETPVIVSNINEDMHFLPADAMVPAQRTQVMAEVLELFDAVNPYRQIVRAEVDMSKEGLGRLPEYIPSVGSVLLFNSGENPYQEYTSWDNVLGVDYEDEEEKRKELAPAPKTIVEGDVLPSVYGLDYDFRPAPGSVEDISAKVPTNLPLENIAEYSYMVESGGNASIAPSHYQNKALPDLPSVGAFADGPSAPQPANLGDVSIGPSDGLPPPPPPAPPVDFDAPSGDEPPPPPPPPRGGDDDDSAPPPPPPPGFEDDAPPPPPPTRGDDGATSPADAVDEEPAEPANPMSSLLAQIRNPNVRLKRVTPGEEKPTTASRPANDKPLTIEDQMKDRLARRLAAISGKQDKHDQELDRARAQKPVVVMRATEVTAPVSELQPPPPPPPPPPVDDDDNDRRRNALPKVDMSDDEDNTVDTRGRGQASDDDSNDGENDFLAQIRNLKKKQDQDGGARPAKPPTASAPPPPPPKAEESTPAIDFSQIRGLRDRSASLSFSEESDWSDD